MKIRRLSILLCAAAILFASCAPASISAAPTEILPLPPTQPDKSPLLIVGEGFTDPDPATWVMLMPAVREYFHYRKLAFIAGDVHLLWEHYPALQSGMDISQGINAEEFFLTNMQGLKPFDGNIFPEYYEKLRVKLSGEEAQVLVHGMELYLWKDGSGKFDDSGGEFKIILFLQRQGDGWTVIKTQDISGP